MTDPELVAKKLAVIETCLADLERLAEPAVPRTDVKEQRFVMYTVQIADPNPENWTGGSEKSLRVYWTFG